VVVGGGLNVNAMAWVAGGFASGAVLVPLWSVKANTNFEGGAKLANQGVWAGGETVKWIFAPRLPCPIFAARVRRGERGGVNVMSDRQFL